MSDNQKIDKTRRNLVIATARGGRRGRRRRGGAVRRELVALGARQGGRRAGRGRHLERSSRARCRWSNGAASRSGSCAAPRKCSTRSRRPTTRSPIRTPTCRLQPEYAKNEYRSIKPELLVLVGICTHLGCSPQSKPAEDKARDGRRLGRAASSAPATAPSSTSPGASTRARRRRSISRCRRTRTCPIRSILIGDDKKGA